MLNDIDRWENEGGRPASQATTIGAAAATLPPVRERPREAASRVAGDTSSTGRVITTDV